MALQYSLTVFEVLACTVTAFLIIVTLYYKWSFKYWKKRNIPVTVEPSIPWGTLPNPLTKGFINVGIFGKMNYSRLKSRGYKHEGGFLFSTPKYSVIHPEYIKNVLQKDFEYFSEREFYHNEKDDSLSANLFAISGEKWKYFRTHLSPAFTSGKMKMMLPSILNCSKQMLNSIDKSCKMNKTVNVKDIMESFTMDVIGACGFGLECNSFKNPQADFKVQGRRAFLMSPFRICKILLGLYCPRISRFLGVTFFDKESNNFFINVVKDAIKFRETNNVQRQDLLQLLINLRTQHKLKPEARFLTIEQITAQAFIFFAAGFETSSTTLSFCLYELSLNHNIQDTLRNEIKETIKAHNGNLTYEAIMGMKYMGQVVDETLRKYPPVSYVSRRCVKDYQIPGTDIKIEKGIEAIVSIMGLHYDPEYYLEPEKFIPERFTDEEKQKRLPFTYLPFGEGPRICIGKRFGLLQTKVGLTMLLKRFRFYLNEKTKVPIEIEPLSFTLLPKSLFLDVEEIKET